MSTSAAPITSTREPRFGRASWEHLWRTAGLQSVGLFVIAWVMFGYQPSAGASPDAVVAFYNGNYARNLIAAVFAGLAILNLMWFAAAIRTRLADAEQDGWGAAVTASSGAVGGLLLLLFTICAALAYSIAASGNRALASGLNDGVGLSRVELLSARHADHVQLIWFLAGRTDLERAVCDVRCRCCACPVGWHDMAKQRSVGARWCLFSVRLTRSRPFVGCFCESNSDAQSSCSCRLVTQSV